VEKYPRAGQATDDITAHAHFMLGPRATKTQTGCVLLIAFPLQQWLHERASMVRYTYIVCRFRLENKCVYCAVRPECLYKPDFFSSLKG